MRPWQALRLPQHAHVKTNQDVDWQIGANFSRIVGGLKEAHDLLSDPVEQGQDYLLVFRVYFLKKRMIKIFSELGILIFVITLILTCWYFWCSRYTS